MSREPCLWFRPKSWRTDAFRPAPHKPGMAAMAQRQKADDRRALIMLADRQDNTLVAPFHGGSLAGCRRVAISSRQADMTEYRAVSYSGVDQVRVDSLPLQKTTLSLPIRFSFGMKPICRLSDELSRLSPMAK